MHNVTKFRFWVVGSLIIMLSFTTFLVNNIERQELISKSLLNNSTFIPLLTPYRILPFYQDAGSAEYGPTPVVLDLNGDNLSDFVFIQSDPDYYVAMNASGEIYWVRPIPIDFYIPLKGDFDRDGYLNDILFYWYYLGPELIAWNENGEEINYAINGSIHYCQASFNEYIGDFNRDGYFDDFILNFSNATGRYCAAVNYFTKKFIWNCSLGQDKSLFVGRLPCDLTHDGHVDDYFLSTADNWTYAIGHDGSLLWSFRGGGVRSGLYRAATIGDLDHDGFQDDIVYISPYNDSIFALDNSGTVLWNFTSLSAKAVKACNYNNDSFVDEICVIETGRVFLLNRTGGIVWSVNNTVSGSWIVIGDVNLDGKVDFLIAAGKLLILNNSGTVLVNQNYKSYSCYPITLADFDRDGQEREILWYSGWQMIGFRWGLPNVTVTLQLKYWKPLRIYITSYEPYITCELNYTIDGNWMEFTIDSQTTKQYSYDIRFQAVGKVVYQVNLIYCDVIVSSDSVTVVGIFSEPWMWGLIGGLTTAIIGWGTFKEYRKLQFKKQIEKELNQTIDKLKNNNSEIRIKAAELLGEIGNRVAGPYLIETLINDDDNRVRAAIITAIGMIGVISAVPLLKRLSKEDPDPEIREYANEAVKILISRT